MLNGTVFADPYPIYCIRFPFLFYVLKTNSFGQLYYFSFQSAEEDWVTGDPFAMELWIWIGLWFPPLKAIMYLDRDFYGMTYYLAYDIG